VLASRTRERSGDYTRPGSGQADHRRVCCPRRASQHRRGAGGIRT